jgi:hypothetical protein
MEQDARLRRSIEQLIETLERRVLENDELLAVLDERDQTITQLEAQVVALQAELQRRRINPRRVGLLAETVSVLAATFVGTFAGSMPAALMDHSSAPNHPSHLVEITGPVGDNVRIVITQCEKVASEAHAARIRSATLPFDRTIEPQGMPPTVQFGGEVSAHAQAAEATAEANDAFPVRTDAGGYGDGYRDGY